MMNNFNDITNLYQRMQQAPNKAQFFAQQFNVQIPENMTNSFDVIQYFLNNGKFTQQQVNSVMNNPFVRGMFRR